MEVEDQRDFKGIEGIERGEGLSGFEEVSECIWGFSDDGGYGGEFS